MANMISYVFKRYELKYLLTRAQYEAVKSEISSRLSPDVFWKNTVQSLYLDTDDFRLVRESLEKPVFKKKAEKEFVIKKLLAFILICIMPLSVFASCGSKTDNSTSGDFPPDMPPQESQTGAGGDGVDSNSRTSYQGIVFAGGEIIIISTSGGNSSIDTEQGYTYSGGTVLALCPANGMGSESLNCKNFSSAGTKTNLNLSQGQTLDVTVNNETVTSVTMPCRLSALVIFLSSQNASFLS